MPSVQHGKLYAMSIVLAIINPCRVLPRSQSLPRRHGNCANIQGVGKIEKHIIQILPNKSAGAHRISRAGFGS